MSMNLDFIQKDITMFRRNADYNNIRVRFKELNNSIRKAISNTPTSTNCIIEQGNGVVAYEHHIDTHEYIIYLDKEIMNIEDLPVIEDIYSIDYTGIDFSKIFRVEQLLNFHRQLEIVEECIIHNALIKLEIAHDLFTSDNSNLRKLDISGCTFPNLLRAIGMFKFNTKLKELILKDVSMPDIKDISEMFKSCRSLEEIDVTFLTKSKNIKSLNYLFVGCSNLKRIVGINELDISKCRSLHGIFQGCLSLEEIDLSSWKADKCNNFSALFFKCKSIKKIDIRNLSFISKSTADKEIAFDNVFNFCKDENTGSKVEVIADDIDIKRFDDNERAYWILQRCILNEADYFPFKPYKLGEEKDKSYLNFLATYVATKYDERINEDGNVDYYKKTQQIISKENWEKEKESLKAKAEILGVDFFDIGFTFGTSSYTNGDIETLSFIQEE